MRKFKQFRKRALAFALCAVMTLSSNAAVFAEGEAQNLNMEESTTSVMEDELMPIVEETTNNEESSQVMEESSQMTEESSQIIEESSRMTEESSQMVEESSQMIEESSQIIEESSQMIEESSQIIEESSQMIGESSQIIEGSSQMTEESSQILEESVQIIEESSQMIEESSKVVEESAKVAGEISMKSEEGKIKLQNTSIKLNVQSGANATELGATQTATTATPTKTDDIETAVQWEANLPSLTKVYGDDVVAIAKSQLGYTQNSENVQTDENGNVTGYYSRYGQWNNTPYAEWDALFVAFCIDYAQVPEERFPQADTVAQWVEVLKSEQYQMFVSVDDEEYIPWAGDLIFFNTEDKEGETEKVADHVAIVAEMNEELKTIKTIEEVDGTVTEKTYNLDDATIYGYGLMPINMEDIEADTLETDATEIVALTDDSEVYVVVDMQDELGTGSINLNIQHWATVKKLEGVNGSDGLIENAGPDGKRFNTTSYLNSKDDFTEIYSADQYELDNNVKVNVEDLSKIISKERENNYILDEMWVLKPGKDATSEEKTDWDIYQMPDTNGQGAEIIVKTDATVRMIYIPVEKANASKWDVRFYDYNISNGSTTGTTLNVGLDVGINHWQNYGASSKEEAQGMERIALGFPKRSLHEAGDVTINGMLVNDSNGGEALAKGIVTSYSPGADEPNYGGELRSPGLFANDERIGKKNLEGYKLGFNKVGDTYILSTVYDAGGNAVAEDLEVFKETYDNGSRHIFSNNFWPLDSVSYTGKDPKFGGSTKYKNQNGSAFGDSDDAVAHNWFFGMRYDFEFSIGDYTGPLNFYFRGDDDFWLFIDGKLVTDIGGIHSSVGENLDLDEISGLNFRPIYDENGKVTNEEELNKVHSVSVFFIERGGSGSTCYMEFTIPNAYPVDIPSIPKTELNVEKKWIDDGANSEVRPNSVEVDLVRVTNYASGETKEEVMNDMYSKTLTAENGWKDKWTGLPLYPELNSSTTYSYYAKEKTVPDGYQSSSITNTSDEGITTIITNTQVIDIPVQKNWVDQENRYGTREAIQVSLLSNGTVVQKDGADWILTLNEANNWQSSWTDLPKYDASNQRINYTLKEITVSSLYDVSYSSPEGLYPGDAGFKLEATNTLKLLPLRVYKYELGKEEIGLTGAKFRLTSTTYPDVTWSEVTTNTNGYVALENLPYGEYKLEEIEAPQGYVMLSYHFDIVISAEGIKVAQHVEGQSDPSADAYQPVDVVDGANTVKVANAKLYELPSTGGSGIHLYTISGAVLMAGAALILYKNKRKEVL